MTSRTKIALFIVFLFCSFGFSLIYSEWKKSERSAELSCLGSIHSATVEALHSGQIKSGDKARKLTKDEINDLIKQGKIGDCGSKKHIFENVHIAIGEVSGTNKPSLRVWTNGDDGISGTNDDLMIPYEENSDQGLNEK